MCYSKFIRNMSPVSEQINIKDKSEVDLSGTSQLVCLLLGGKKAQDSFMSLWPKFHFTIHPKGMINNLVNKLVQTTSGTLCKPRLYDVRKALKIIHSKKHLAYY